MRILKKEDIQKVFTMKEAVAADKEAFRLYSENKSVVPLRTNIQGQNKGNMLFMPGYVEELSTAGIKIVSVYPENPQKGLPVTPAKVLLLDGQTGDVTCLLDGTYVTQLRTGAATGVAFDLLARKDAQIGALFGTGGQAASQLEAMITVRQLKEVRVFGRNKENALNFVKKMQEKFPKVLIKLTESPDEAIENADVITLVTNATRPIFDGNKVKKGATISAVGSYMPQMQELDPVVLQKATKIYFDSLEAVLEESGDILKPLANGMIREYDFTGEIGEVVNGNLIGRENDEEI
ncbi:MAG: ornithine cyclodeaminase family protein, partial [Streptococcaceae bacterium]|nr:ornithine cyclodeaminase family protein [Streptococcaceae bacterium]